MNYEIPLTRRECSGISQFTPLWDSEGDTAIEYSKYLSLNDK